MLRFLCRLALVFRIPVSELADRMPAWEVRLWMAYFQVEPPPDERAAWQIAGAQAMYVNANKRDTDKRTNALDFILFHDTFGKRAREQAEAERYSELDREIIKALR